MSAFLQFLGRLHPLVLHFPIGLVVTLAAWEAIVAIGGRAKGESSGRPPRLLVGVAALSVFGAVATGLLLAREGGWENETLERHRNLGLSTLGAAVALLVVIVRAARPHAAKDARWIAPLLYLTAFLITITGHFGATLTHGEGFLTQPFRAQADAAPLPQDPTTPATESFTSDILPLFQKYCIECHGAQKAKGGLALHTAALARKGGDSGPLVLPQKPGGGELPRRLALPRDDEDHMPPRGKSQPTPTERAVMDRWIAAGGNF